MYSDADKPLYEVKANLFKGLAHPVRIRVLELLSGAPEVSVAELIERYRSTRFGSWPVQGFALFESTPGQSGSVYTVLERYPLNA